MSTQIQPDAVKDSVTGGTRVTHRVHEGDTRALCGAPARFRSYTRPAGCEVCWVCTLLMEVWYSVDESET